MSTRHDIPSVGSLLPETISVPGNGSAFVFYHGGIVLRSFIQLIFIIRIITYFFIYSSFTSLSPAVFTFVAC